MAAHRLDQYLRLTRTVRPGNADPDWYYRQEAVELLGRCGRPAVAALVESTRDYDDMVRKIAWHWLETMSDQVDDQDARQAAAEALEKIRAEETGK